MAVTQLHTPIGATKVLPAGAASEALRNWSQDGVGTRTPFGGANGADAASGLLLKAHALTACLSAAFQASEEAGETEFALLRDGCKALALDAIGDLILLAKFLADET